jgi:hypothetical protein
VRNLGIYLSKALANTSQGKIIKYREIASFTSTNFFANFISNARVVAVDANDTGPFADFSF